METVANFTFWGYKITADSDCSLEINRCLLLGRKIMTNLDSILKSRDIILPTKVRLVKVFFFFSPVVMYGCECSCKESWLQSNWCFWTVLLEETLEYPLDYNEIQPVHPKGNQSFFVFFCSVVSSVYLRLLIFLPAILITACASSSPAFLIHWVDWCWSSNNLTTWCKEQTYWKRLWCCLYGPTLTCIYDYWKNNSFDYMDFCWPSDDSAF